MARKFPLQILLDLSQSHADAAAKSLLALKVRWHEAEEKLGQLLAYREGYRDRLRDLASSAAALRDFQLFMVKLDTAIKLQQDEVARCQSRWNTGQQEWLRQRGKVKAYDALSARHKRAEEKREESMEQKEQDEFATKQDQGRRTEGE
ncbi:MAG: flagellar export protein FliJ [Sulfurimicrobium sp.]|nr:flagellar export protein FliJ [Sulfurimicrobium sp.]